MPGAFKLDHLQPVKPILFPKFYNFFTFILGGQFLLPQRAYMRKGNSPNSKIGQDREFSVPGAFKLHHLQPVKPILFSRFSNFFTFILGGQFLLPQRANNEKGEFIQLQKWMMQRIFSAWGIQIGPFAAICTFQISKISQLVG